MPQRSPSARRSMYDFAALVAVLATGVALVALGVAPESLAAVTIALSALYSTWRVGHVGRPSELDSGPERQPEDESGLDPVAELAPEKRDHSQPAP
ncbi:hypothetical protein ABT083_21590 [Streptomyces goshikiensis]|uniref:hypothetical protein n=1 Tax=Streptomyces TaxID=1883 RepID=UPI00331ACB33